MSCVQFWGVKTDLFFTLTSLKVLEINQSIMSRPSCSLTKSQMSSIIIPTSEPRDIMSSLSTSSIVEVDSRDSVKFNQLSFLCLSFCTSSEGCYKGVQIVCWFWQVNIDKGVSSLLVLFVHWWASNGGTWEFLWHWAFTRILNRYCCCDMLGQGLRLKPFSKWSVEALVAPVG